MNLNYCLSLHLVIFNLIFLIHDMFGIVWLSNAIGDSRDCRDSEKKVMGQDPANKGAGTLI